MLGQEFLFFQSFLDNLEKEPPPKSTLLHLNDFRHFVLQKIGKTIDTVKIMAPYFLNCVVMKPQRLLFDHQNFYISLDYVTNTYYACFKDLTMIDIDYETEISTTKEGETSTSNEIETDEREEKITIFCAEYLQWLVNECERNFDWRFAIFRT